MMGTDAAYRFLGVLSVLAVVGLLAYGLASPRSTMFGPALSRLMPGPEIALTFDDGPSEDTARILDILRDKGVPATFFLSGAHAERYPALAQRIVAEGHVVGNHTFTHPCMYLMSRRRIASEIDRAENAIEKATGVRPTLFRPPYGVRWFTHESVLEERSMEMVLWSCFPREGASSAAEIVQRALASLAPGVIIVLHDGREALLDERNRRGTTVEALPAIIDGARKAGYRFVPLPRSGRRPA